jgi:cytoskeleton protein RodZ
MASFGENLRRERELRGVSLRDIADATKISVRFLEALEKGRMDLLPGGLFARAFVKQYARHLGLDVDRTVADFLYAYPDAVPEKAPTPPAPRTPFPRGVLVFVGVTLLAGALSWRAMNTERVARPQDAIKRAVPTPAVLPTDRVYPVPTPVPSAPATAAASAPADPTPAPDGLVLTLTAQQSCWVHAQADGQTVINRVLSEGETETLEAEGQIVLSVGNAGGLALTVNDRPGVPLGKSGEVKRNIVITKQSLPSFVQEAAPAVRASHSG